MTPVQVLTAALSQALLSKGITAEEYAAADAWLREHDDAGPT